MCRMASRRGSAKSIRHKKVEECAFGPILDSDMPDKNGPSLRPSAEGGSDEQLPLRERHGSFWSDLGRELLFIDDSLHSSMVLNGNGSAGGRQLSFDILGLSQNSSVIDNNNSNSHSPRLPSMSDSKYTSQQTLNVFEIGGTPLPVDDSSPRYSSYPQLTPVPRISDGLRNSCPMEVDEQGRSRLCTQPIKQLSFSDTHSDNKINAESIPTDVSNEFFPSKLNNACSKEMSDLMAYLATIEKDFRYYFQHPYPRLFITYFVIFCNFLIFAEDPVSHSHTESEIPVVGNVFSFVITKYPPDWYWKLVKVLLWSFAIILGLVIGKQVIHKLIFGRLFRLKMFYDEQGSWMIMFLTVIVTLYIFSNIYNTCLMLFSDYPDCKYQITAVMGVTHSQFMKAAACGTWLGDFVTAWMVSDMMLQDNLYPDWAPRIRAFWRTGNTRIVTFWFGACGVSALVITLIVSDWINWDQLNRDFVATTELSRAFLASFILVMDLLIVMQDWDFPHFTSMLDINLPGMKIPALRLNFCRCISIKPYWRIHITGKWFNYGIILMVMILDLNMWKNQIFYVPEDYGQYIGPDHKIYTVSDPDVLAEGNKTLWSYEYRSSLIDPVTNLSYREIDMKMNSRYLGYPVAEKCTAFIPSVLGFFLFGLLIYLYGRFPPQQSEILGGRLRQRKKQYRSSWRRDRANSFRASISKPSENELDAMTIPPVAPRPPSKSLIVQYNNSEKMAESQL